MYIEFVRNLLLQSEARREQERLGELEAGREDRETWRRTGEGKREKGGNERQMRKKTRGESEDREIWGRRKERQRMRG